MQLNCFTQYASKFGKLSNSYKTVKSQFSPQSQRKGMPKNVQTTTKLHSFYMLVRWYSKPFKLSFNSTWTRNFQMDKLDLEKAGEPEIKLPTSSGSWKSKRVLEKTSTSLIMLKALNVWITTNWKICKEMRIQDHLILLLRNRHAGQEVTKPDTEPQTDSKLGKE